MGKKNAQRNAHRKQKAATKSKARAKRKHQAKLAQQAQGRATTKAKKEWPPESEFSTEEHLYWIQHGVNYLSSDIEEGVWKPLFPGIYEGKSQKPEEIAQAIMGSSEGEDLIDMMAWSAQPRLVVYMLRQRCIARLRADKGVEVGEASLDTLKGMVAQPHDPSVWGVFDDLRLTLREKRQKRQAPGDPLEGKAFSVEDIEAMGEKLKDVPLQPPVSVPVK